MHQALRREDHQASQEAEKAANLIRHQRLRRWRWSTSFYSSETSNEEVHSKKGKLKNDCFPGLMIVEQIQDLIANTIKVQLGGFPI